jgi:drug/metabolite transporter (DMT)-like permease
LVNKVNPFQINFIRFFIGGIILLAFLAVKKNVFIGLKDLGATALIGIINVVISMNLIQISLFMEGAKASVVAVIFSSNPIFVSLIAVLIDKEKINYIKLIGLIMGVVGIFAIFFEDISLSGTDFISPLLALLSAAFFGLYTVLGRKVSVRIGSLKMNAYSFIIGSLTLLPILAFFKMPVIRFDHSAMGQIIYLSVFVTGIAYLTYFKGLSIAGAGKGSLVFFVKPVLASVIAIVYLKEQAAASLFIGTALILSGITLVIKSEELHKKAR